MVIETNKKAHIVVSGHFTGAAHGASFMAIRFIEALQNSGYSVVRIDRSLSKSHKELQKISIQKMVKVLKTAMYAVYVRIAKKYRIYVSIPANITPSLLIDVLLLKILKRKKCLNVCYVHGKFIWNRVYSKLIRSYLNSFEVFITPSEEISKSMKLIGVDSDKIKVVYNSLPQNWKIAPQPLDAVIPVKKILYLSAVSRMKGVSTLLDAYLELSMMENQLLPELHIAGPEREGDMFNNVKRWAIANNLEKHIYLHGSLCRSEVVKYLSSPAVFVFPSWYEEAFGLVLIEAMSCGIPIIASEIGAIPEVLDIAGQGNLFPPRDSHVLADRLARLINDGRAREATSKKGLEIVNSKYTYKTYLRRIKNVMAESQALVRNK